MIDDRLQALVGGHCYANAAPADAPVPRLVFVLVDDDRGFVLAGLDGTSTVRVQVDAWARNSVAAAALSLRVFDAMAAPGADFDTTAAQRLPGDHDTATQLHCARWEFTLEP
ncbi:DUF3168 domain-containing protein [Pseudomonas sp. NPDC086581]|uniref:tail completion protein gp17 n=1 Tax=Pseudomonas sp. NPDC086581 TaxID=3364432 RepID=UPI003828B44A